MHRGYIKLYRAIWDTDLWDDKPYSKLRAWIDILMLANHKEGQFEVRGHVIKVGRGQLGRSKKKLGARWKWSEKKVETFLKRLKYEHQIEYQTNNVTTLITIVNYEKYQGEEDQKETQKKPKGSAEEAQKKTNKNVKNVKKEKDTSAFNEFWGLYPERDGRKVGKAKSLENFLKIPSASHMDVLKAVKNYSVSDMAKRGFAKDPQRFLLNSFWKDWLETTNGGSGIKHLDAAGQELEIF